MSLASRLNDNKAEYRSVKDILSDCQYFIPEYQRAYSWTSNQLGEFFDSLIALCEANILRGNDHLQNYLGPILIKPKDNHNDKYDILDGQQRLTTFSLIIYAIERQISTELSEDHHGIYSSQQSTIEKILRDLRSCLEYNQVLSLVNATELRLVHSEPKDKANLYELFFQHRAKYPNNRIYTNYKEINQRINDMTELDFFKNKEKSRIEKLNYIARMCISNTYLLRTELKDVESAFAIFESLNTTGLQLTPFDLINGYMIEKIKDSHVLNEWKNKVSDYRSNSDMKLDEYVFYWLNSKGRAIDKLSVFKEAKEYISHHTAETTAREMIDVFDDLFEYLQKEDFVPTFLSLFKRKKVIPIYILMKSKGYDSNSINAIMLQIIKYSVIELNLLGKSPGTFQYKLKQILEMIYNRTEKIVDFNEIVNEIPDISSDYSGYRTSIDVYNSLTTGILRDQNVNKGILLMLMEKQNTNVLPKFKTIDIEHIFPQNPDEEWYTHPEWKNLEDQDDERERITFMLGNSMLLDSKINRSIKNKYITKKKDAISAALSPESYLRLAKWNNIDFDNFDKDVIVKRTSEIIQLLKELSVLY